MKISDFFYRVWHWETWPYLVKYVPLAPPWLWYCLRARSFWFFTPSNPTLTFGGFEGESKNEMYLQLPGGSYPRSIYISHLISFKEAVSLFTSNNFSFPFAVKPDVGMMGFMFRKIENIEQFKKYHAAMQVDYCCRNLLIIHLK